MQWQSDAALDALVDEARDYFWVEYRLSAAEPWQAAHPAFHDNNDAPTIAKAAETFTSQIPDDLIQRLRIRVYIEQKTGEELTEHDIIPVWDRPAADLIGHPITLQTYPNGLTNLGDTIDLDGVLSDTNLFLPMLDGKVAANGQAFDLNGNVFDLQLFAQGGEDMVKVAQGASSAVEKAAGILGALDATDPTTNPEDAITLAGVWIEYTLVAPGGEEKSFRRPVMDRIGAENRGQNKVAIAAGMEFPTAARALLTNHTISVLPGDYTSAYVADRILERMGDELALFAALPSSPANKNEIPPKVIESLNALRPLDDALLSGAFGAATNLVASSVSYRPEPTLVVTEEGFDPGKKILAGFARTDVLNNTRRTLQIDDEGNLSWDPAAALAAGVWETNVEGVPIAGVGGVRFNTRSAFEAAKKAGTPIGVFALADAAAVDELDLDAQSKEAIQRDLNAGYVVIVPVRPGAIRASSRLVARAPDHRRDAGRQQRRARPRAGRIYDPDPSDAWAQLPIGLAFRAERGNGIWAMYGRRRKCRLLSRQCRCLYGDRIRVWFDRHGAGVEHFGNDRDL